MMKNWQEDSRNSKRNVQMASVKSNIKFFNQLLSDGNITEAKRLVLSDLMTSYLEGACKSKEELQKLRSKLNDFENIQKNIDDKVDANTKYHDPVKVVILLKRFTNKDYLRWCVHRWDRNVATSYDEFIQILDNKRIDGKTYKQLVHELEDYNKSLSLLLYAFLFQDKEYSKGDRIIKYEWGQKKVTIGWRFPIGLIEKWCDEDGNLTSLGKSPFEMRFDEEIAPKIIEERNRKIKTTVLSSFDSVANTFKREIQFRHKDFYKMVKKNIDLMKEELDPKFFPEESFVKKLFENDHNPYTYTSAIQVAWEIIHSMIQERQEEIEKSTKRSDYSGSLTYTSTFENYNGSDFRVISIIHNHSFPTSSIDQSDKIKGLQGDLASLRRILKSVAHFSIESDFPTNDESKSKTPYRVTYLDGGNLSKVRENFKPEIEELDDLVNGFRYIIKLPV